jgi:hypothetical protein
MYVEIYGESYASRYVLRSREISLYYHQHLFSNLFFINILVSVRDIRTMLSLRNGTSYVSYSTHKKYFTVLLYTGGAKKSIHIYIYTYIYVYTFFWHPRYNTGLVK